MEMTQKNIQYYLNSLLISININFNLYLITITKLIKCMPDKFWIYQQKVLS